LFKKKAEIKGFKRHEFLEIGPGSRLIFHSIKEYLRMTEYIVRFDTETARANSIVFIIGLLIGFVIGVYDRTLQYSNLFLGIHMDSFYTSSHTLCIIHARP
jgi:CIC family chloride channel protein